MIMKEIHMNLANQKFDKNSSNNTDAIFALGKAMHYFADMNAPHHVANLIAGASSHAEWESYGNPSSYNTQIIKPITGVIIKW